MTMPEFFEADTIQVTPSASRSTSWPVAWEAELLRQSRRRRSKRAGDEHHEPRLHQYTVQQIADAQAELAGAWRWQLEVFSTERG